MTEHEPTVDEVRRLIDEAAEPDDTGQLLAETPALHAEEKARRSRVILKAIGIDEPTYRPLWQARVLWPESLARCPDAELHMAAGPPNGPIYTILLSPSDIDTIDTLTHAVHAQSGLEVDLGPLMHPSESATEFLVVVVAALRQLALTKDDWEALVNQPGGTLGP